MNYKDFVVDFPDRCHAILSAHWSKAKHSEREVTLLVMTVMAGLVMPYERLDGGKENRDRPQPTLDRPTLQEARAELKRELDNQVAASELFGEQYSWHFGNLPPGPVTPENWEERRQPLTGVQVAWAIQCLRHALAHCNLFSRGSRRDIEELVFVSGYADQTQKYVAVSPSDLREFLRRWFSFLGALPLQTDDVAKAMRDAA